MGAASNFGIALLHVIIIFVGTPAYIYFGAADLGRMASEGSSVPMFLTLGLVIVFTVFGLYALSGAGVLRPLPLLIPSLFFIGSIYTLRGLILILDILRLLRGADYPFRQTVFSAAALIIGLCHVVGTAQRWEALHDQRTPGVVGAKSQ